MVFGPVGNPAVPVLLKTSFIDKFVKSIFPPEHKILFTNSAPVPIIATIVKVDNGQDRGPQEGDNVEEVTIVEEKYETSRLI